MQYRRRQRRARGERESTKKAGEEEASNIPSALSLLALRCPLSRPAFLVHALPLFAWRCLRLRCTQLVARSIALVSVATSASRSISEGARLASATLARRDGRCTLVELLSVCSFGAGQESTNNDVVRKPRLPGAISCVRRLCFCFEVLNTCCSISVRWTALTAYSEAELFYFFVLHFPLQ